jgi:hypothetical protein
MFTRSVRSAAIAGVAALALATVNPGAAEAKMRRNDAAALAVMGLVIGTIAAIAAAEAHRRDHVHHRRHHDRDHRRHWHR